MLEQSFMKFDFLLSY